MNGAGWIRAGAVAGFLAVGLGAFGAHGFKERLEELGQLDNYQTAFEYHMAHALAVIAVGLLGLHLDRSRSIQIAGWSFLVGIVIFSGSLYILALTGLRWLGAITPIGGVAFLVGWTALAISAGKSAKSPSP